MFVIKLELHDDMSTKLILNSLAKNELILLQNICVNYHTCSKHVQLNDKYRLLLGLKADHSLLDWLINCVILNHF